MRSVLDQPLTPQSLVDAVVDRLEEAILKGEIAGGTKLLEQVLALSLGVSRSVVREAIRRLEGRKLVNRTPFVGAQVASLSVQDLADIMLVREALEGMACRLAAQTMSDKEVAELKLVIERQHRAKKLRQGASHYMEMRDYDFHYRIAEGSGNRRLVDMLCGDLYYLLKVYRFRSGTVPERSEEILAEHRAIAAAIADRDPELAERRMRAHIQRSRANMLARLRLDAAASDHRATRTRDRPRRRRAQPRT